MFHVLLNQMLEYFLNFPTLLVQVKWLWFVKVKTHYEDRVGFKLREICLPLTFRLLLACPITEAFLKVSA